MPPFCQGFQPKALTPDQWWTCAKFGKGAADRWWARHVPADRTNGRAAEAGSWVAGHHQLVIAAVVLVVALIVVRGARRLAFGR
jgi:hypothetical protein